MDCIFDRIGDAPLGHLFRCTICTRCFESQRDEAWKIRQKCPGFVVDDKYRVKPSREREPPPPTDGPGLETKLIFAALGLTPKKQCQCEDKAAWMNRWGVEGCKQRRALIVSWLRSSQQWYGPEEQAVAAYKAVRNGLAFKLDLLDLFGSIVDLAIARAEAKLPAQE